MMKKNRFVALLLALLMALSALPVVSFAATQIAFIKKGVTVNVRKEPKVRKNNVIVRLTSGTKVNVKYKVGSWTKIGWGSSKKNEGYVVGKYLTSTTAVAPSGCMYVKTHDKMGLNLRTGPSDKYSIIRVIPDGKAVEILSAKSKGWIMVKYKKSVGYVYAKYLSATK